MLLHDEHRWIAAQNAGDAVRIQWLERVTRDDRGRTGVVLFQGAASSKTIFMIGPYERMQTSAPALIRRTLPNATVGRVLGQLRLARLAQA